MRLAVRCVSCVLALAARATCDTLSSEQKAGTWLRSSFDNVAGWPQVFGLQRLEAQPAVYEFTETRIVETVVTESHPRITQAPIVRRKLGSNKWDQVHDAIQGRKRDATICPTDYQLCPQSLNGGCCPTDRVCGTASCYPATTGPASACGTVGYYACGIDAGGGCCPTNYNCGVDGCVPSAGVSNTLTCGASSYACPASLNFGCCPNGQACGLTDCYSTAVQTFTVTEIITTTSSGHVETITSKSVGKITPTPPSVASTVSDAGPTTTVAKVTTIPSPVEKVAATSPAGGLTKGQLGGIIAGCVILLVVILVVAFLILRRLNKVKKAIEESSKSHRSYRTWSQSGRTHKKSSKARDKEIIQEAPTTTPSDISKHVRHPSEPSPIHVAHEMEASPSLSSATFSPNSPFAPQHHPKHAGGYAPVATSEPPSPPLQNYRGFSPITPDSDGTVPPPDLRDQNLRFGHHSPIPPPGPSIRPSQHERQWSGDSNASGFSQGSSAFSESDPGVDKSVAGSNSQNSFYGFRWLRGPRR